MTKVCIFGAGAVGGYLAAALSNTDAKVSLIARGEHKKVILEKGLTLIKDGASNSFKFFVTENTKDLEIQDYIFISIKAQSIPSIVESLIPIMNKNTTIISAVNGLPWWYFHKANTGTILDEKHIESVDLNGKIWSTINPERSLGCVVYPACEILEPGTIRINQGDRFSLGEPDGTKSERLDKIASLLIKGGLKAPKKKNLRDEIWVKLMGNCSFNPVSALTNKTLDEIGKDPDLINTIKLLMKECRQVGEKIGIKFNVSIEDRIEGAISIIGHKPSTTHDINSGKPLEIDPLIGSIIELGNKLNIQTPNLKKIYLKIKNKAEDLGLYERNQIIEKITE
ncbi:2-dehydropantoate 2-reductase [Pelagibacterales bacterium SAG-MED17]|nr:2-dehydropantoate 2-reductase [Pelagibacterales bacterium SAG-MED17]